MAASENNEQQQLSEGSAIICYKIVSQIPQTVLKVISTQISWKKFFSEKIFFQGLGAFFMTAKPPFRPHLFPHRIYLFIFFKCDYLILI